MAQAPIPTPPSDLDAAVARLTGMRAPGRRPAAPRSWRRIVVAVDPFGSSANPASWALALAAPGTRIDLVAILSPDDLLSVAAQAQQAGTTLTEMRATETRRAKRALDALQRRLVQKGAEVRLVIRPGLPTAEILAAIDDARAELVILGSHGHGRMDRVMLGSVADGIKNHAQCDVLLARAPFRRGFLLAPVDGSARSSTSVRAALSLGASWGVPVHVLHVFGFNVLRYAEIGKEEFEAVLRKHRLPRRSKQVHYVLDFGNPARQIVKYAKDRRPSLVVMGSRGLGAIAGAVMGAVSNRVAHESPASCLFIKR